MCSVLRLFKSLFIILIRVTFCIFLVVLLPPLLLLCFTPFFLYRSFVIQLARCARRDFGKILSARSAMICPENIYKAPYCTLTLVPVVEGLVDLEKVREMVKTTMELRDENGQFRYPEMQQNICKWMGFPFFRNLKKFRIEDHVNYYNGDENLTNLNDFKTVMEEFNFKPFSEDYALWEIIIIRNPKPGPKPGPFTKEGKKYSAIIFREHHALADAFSLARLFQCFSPSRKFELMEGRDYTHTSKISQVSFCRRVMNFLGLCVKIPWDISAIVTFDWSTLSGVWEKDKEQKRTLLKSPKYVNSPESYSKTYVGEYSETFRYKDSLKEIKTIHGVSGISAIYAAICGATRNTMFPRTLAKKEKLPRDILMMFPLPAQGRNHKLRNSVALGAILLPVGEPDPIKRLKIIHQRTGSLKESTLPLILTLLGILNGWCPGFITRLTVRLNKRVQFVGLSNTAGPQNAYELFGYPCVDMYAVTGTIVRSSCLGFMFITEMGHAKIGVGADAKILPSADYARQLIHNFLEELKILSRNTDSPFSPENV